MVLLNGKFPKIGFFLSQLILYFFLLNVYHAPSNTQTLVVEMIYGAPFSINGFFLAQLILYLFLLNVYHAPRNTQTLVVEMLDVKNNFV